MRRFLALLCAGGLLLSSFAVAAQPPPGKEFGKKEKKGKKGPPPGGASEAADLVAYLMSFDANQDGQLTRAELTDTRLHRLFDRADTKKAGVLTRAELITFVA